ncbi:phosphorylase family protein [Paraburkholderia caribensis]|uniref:phosphorylase family protein n=1 Tax=Paraburkholderia caribensis TaxID=75105 RepID=UPI00071EC637|nr:hypothetical protein [Paraburkholderia caribensis]ALP68603.1 hypothetical protein AN416_38470 [Paraburkholderia caribensis]AUT57961.1 hypothetical protein C2L66_39485 [Paraburkholderia caribensis]
MTYRLQLRWKILSEIPRSAPLEALESAPPIFQKRTGKSLLREIGSNAKETFVPTVLEPTHVFYNALLEVKHRHQLAGKKFPFVVPLSLGLDVSLPVRVNFAIRLYGNVACISADSDDFEAPDNVDFERVTELESHASLLEVVRFIVSVIVQGTRHPKATGDGLRILPCLQIASDDASPLIANEKLAAIVTGHADVNSNVMASLISRNRDHQIDNTSLLTDKQGLVFYAPAGTSAPSLAGMKRRFRSAVGMLELAAAIQFMLKGKFEIPRHDLQTIDRLINDSELVFSDSVSGRKLWELTSDAFKLPAYLKGKKAMNISNNAIKVLCVAAAPIELTTIKRFLESQLRESHIVRIGDGKAFDPVQRFIDNRSGVQWYLASLDAQGNGSASTDVGRLTRGIQPDHVIMVGMCMGMPDAGLEPGTVVVPDALFSLEHQRATKDGTEFRPLGGRGNSGLRRLAKLVSTEAFDFKVVFGKKLASASVKIEDPKAEIVTYLQQFAKDVVAFDMEGWGFYEAAEDFSCLWIKAVADTGEPQEASSNGREGKQGTQADVTTNAIRFAFRLIQEVAKLQPAA